MGPMTDRETIAKRNALRTRWPIGLAIGLLVVPGLILADQSLLPLLRPDTLPWLGRLMQRMTWLGYGPLDVGIPLAVGLGGWWRGRAGCARGGVLGGLAVAIAGILDQVVKNLTCRARPSAEGAGAFLADFPCVPAPYELASFPSGHATTAFALATLLALWYPRGTAGFLLVATLVGWSRVALGSHFPSDVLAGAILGSAVVLWLSNVWKLWDERQCKLEDG
jgi:membrane-associated phospholipid phosphatase